MKQPKKKAILKILPILLIACILLGSIPFLMSFAKDYREPLDYRSAEMAEAYNMASLLEEPTRSIADTISLEDEFAPNQIIVVLKHRNSRVNATARKSWFSGMGVTEVRDLSARKDTGGKIFGMNVEEYERLYSFRQILLLTLNKNSKQNIVNTIRQLEELDFVLLAEPNYQLTLLSASSNPPDDPLLSQQWGLDTINALAAWESYNPNVPDVKVAVIDTGIAFHEDLDDNVDPILGGVFFEPSEGCQVFNPRQDIIVGHGTHVAGIIGAVGNNGIGISGIAHDVALVSCLFDARNGQSAASSAIAAIEYASSSEIPIINASFGGSSDDGMDSLEISIEQYPGLMVCGAGNNYLNNENIGSDNDIRPVYPASLDLDNIISVASISSDLSLSIFSNYGATSVHIAAPGHEILSTVPLSNEGILDPKGTYANMSGTSMAAPHVAGVAALLKGNFPKATTAQIKEAILMSAVYTDALDYEKPENDGKGVSTKGRLDAKAALDYMSTLSFPPSLLATMAVYETNRPADYCHSAYVNAVDVVTDANATEPAICTAAEMLDAFNNNALPQIKEMRNCFAYCEELIEQEYTPGSWSALTTALNGAITIYNYPLATASDINVAWAALDQACQALELGP